MRHILLTILICFCSATFAVEPDSVIVAVDSACVTEPDTMVVAERPATFKEKAKHNFFTVLSRIQHKLFDVDTFYIEPQHYKFQTMMQSNFSYEAYRITDNEGNSIRFTPKPSMKVGPYVCWGILGYGLSIDMLHLKGKDNRQEFDMSFYTLPMGFDLFYRKSGNEYRITDVKFANHHDASVLNGCSFNGIKSSVVGLNAYYIFNHRRFSYPAAFNQSTKQKVSAGSALAGIGYTRHSLDVDWSKLNILTEVIMGEDFADEFTGEKTFEHVTYTDLSLSGGYGYNWVFPKNWLFCSSLSLALSYKRSISNSSKGINGIVDNFVESLTFRDFKFTNLTIDGVGRFGVVWNDNRWFAGANFIMHAYNYSKANFYTNNIFGSFNIYAGFNFGVKKKYRKQ